jgi:two-component system phosphate regulon sensor histidine kinase PhoR
MGVDIAFCLGVFFNFEKTYMNWILLSLLGLLLISLIGLSWQYITLKRKIKHFYQVVRSVSEGSKTIDELPEDLSRLEDLSNTVKNLARLLEMRTSTVDAERNRLAAVLDRMTDGVLIADADGQIQFANPAIEKIFTTDNPVGGRVVEVLRQYQLVEAWQRSLENGEAQEESVELPTQRRFIQLIVLPDRQTGGSLLLVQDLTRVRRLETVRRDFISNVSHELRTPLASLKALTETLRDGAIEDPQAATRFIARIEKEVDALTQMATELLELSRIESGQVPLQFKGTPAGKILLSAAERMGAQIERAGMVLRVENADNVTEVKVDQPRLEQVLVNLIHNAVKFSRPGGEVVLSTENTPGFVAFSVRDSGIGIPSEDLGRIFERFYKTDRARSSGGTGLGLSISRHLVEAHGGRIWAESVEGQGSTFHFTIPCA